MNIVSKVFGHLKNILIHKYYVLKECWSMGLYWQGIVHDLSKLSWTEFKESVIYYSGGRSPIINAKDDVGISYAWQHHKGRNPHHAEYWTDNYATGLTAHKMPLKYLLECLADYVGAAKTYNKRNGIPFTWHGELKWWEEHKKRILFHPETENFITSYFTLITNLEKNNTKINKKRVINYVLVLTKY